MRQVMAMSPEATSVQLYRDLCEAWDLDPVPSGYALVLAEDENGAHRTVAFADISRVTTLSPDDPVPADRSAVPFFGWPNEGMVPAPREPLTVREYAFLTPEALGDAAAYRKVCRAAAVDPIPAGYGLVYTEDRDGRRWTLFTEDVTFAHMYADAEALAGLEVPVEKFPIARPGWPDDWVDPQLDAGTSRRSAQARKRRNRKRKP
jgi:hypothetical protein